MKILIIKPSSLGDVVHALRVVSFMKENINHLEIHWVIKKGLEGIISSSGLIDKYFIFHRGKGLKVFWQLGLSLRKESYDIVLDMQGLLRSAFLAKLANGKSCFGRPDGREFSTFFYKTVNSPTNKHPHAIDRLCSFTEIFNLPPNNELQLSFKESRLNDSLKIKLNSGSNRVLLFPESRRPEKCWPYFQDLSKLLKERNIGKVLISGTQKDGDYIDALDLRGKVKLESLPSLINQVDIVVANDSAPLHIASALGVPVVGVFGPTNAMLYGPYPKESKFGSTISSSSNSISDISVEEVYNKTVSILKEIKK